MELADILIQVVIFSLGAEVDLGDAALRKRAEDEAKYPVEKAHGRATKYTDL